MEQVVANTNFAEHLVKHGACTSEVSEELCQQARSSWKPLARVMLESKRLSMREVSLVLAQQAMEPRSLFGEVAVQMGFCSREEVDKALEEQRSSSPHILELATGHPRVDQKLLLEALSSYVRFIERTLARLDDALL